MSTDRNESGTTHFGYRDVPTDAKSGMVASVFRSVASRYDVMNDLMSFGVHRFWKQFAIALANLRPGQRVLDVAGGSGDMTALAAARVGATGRVVLSDINDAMLDVGRERLADYVASPVAKRAGAGARADHVRHRAGDPD